MISVFDCQVEEVSDDVVSIKLPDMDHWVVLTKDAYQKAVAVATDAQNFHEQVRAAVQSSLEDWRANRGPNSELGRNMEQGTPLTDHSSEGNR